MKSESPQKPITPCNLREYIAFLREHNFHKEADYYEIEVVDVLKKAGIPCPLTLMTKEVVAALYGIVDAAEASVAANTKSWEVELVR